MPFRARTHRRRRASTAAAVAVAGALAVVTTSAASTAQAASPAKTPQPASQKPTVVLVHGAFADSSSWYGVIDRLHRDGYSVRAVPNRLRGVSTDSAAVADVLHTIKGPVVLAGHSYGGAVITNAAADDPNVKALVYIAAEVPDKDEKLSDLSKHPIAHPLPPLPTKQVPTTLPDGTKGTDIYLDPAQFRARFAADVDPRTAADMAATQRPLVADTGTSEAAAWRTIPSWYLVANQDRTIAPDLERWMAERAGAHTEEIDSSHAAMVSHPGAVTHLIEEADHDTR